MPQGERKGEWRWLGHRSCTVFRMPPRRRRATSRSSRCWRSAERPGAASSQRPARSASLPRSPASSPRRPAARGRRGSSSSARGLAGLTVRLPAPPGGLRDPGLRGRGPRRRPLLDAARRLRRRADRRARRRADRPGPHRRSATSPRSSGSSSTTCSPPSRTGPSRSTTSTARRTPTPRRRTTSSRSGRSSTRTSPPRATRRLCDTSTQRGRELDAMSIVDWIERVGAGRHGLAARPAARRGLQHRVRRRVHRAELAQPALPARLLGPGPAAHLRAVEREVPRRAAATTRSRPHWRRPSPARSRPGRSSSRSSATPAGRYTLTFRQGSGTTDGDRRPRRARAAVLASCAARWTTRRPASSRAS